MQRIAIATDHPATGDELARVLRRAFPGVGVSAGPASGSASGPGVLDAADLEARPPCLLVLDLALPARQWQELLRRAARLEPRPRVAAIARAVPAREVAELTVETLLDAEAAGVDRFVTLPAEPAVVAEVLGSLFVTMVGEEAVPSTP